MIAPLRPLTEPETPAELSATPADPQWRELRRHIVREVLSQVAQISPATSFLPPRVAWACAAWVVSVGAAYLTHLLGLW